MYQTQTKGFMSMSMGHRHLYTTRKPQNVTALNKKQITENNSAIQSPKRARDKRKSTCESPLRTKEANSPTFPPELSVTDATISPLMAATMYNPGRATNMMHIEERRSSMNRSSQGDSSPPPLDWRESSRVLSQLTNAQIDNQLRHKIIHSFARRAYEQNNTSEE